MAVHAFLIDEKGYLQEAILLSPNQIWQLTEAASKRIVICKEGNPSEMKKPRWTGSKWTDDGTSIFDGLLRRE